MSESQLATQADSLYRALVHREPEDSEALLNRAEAFLDSLIDHLEARGARVNGVAYMSEMP